MADHAETEEFSSDGAPAEDATRHFGTSSEELFRAIVESGSSGIFLLDHTARIVYSAGPSILGYRHEELVGRSAFELLAADGCERLRDDFNLLLKDAAHVVRTRQRAVHKSGHDVWLEATAVNLLATPSVDAVAVNYHDVTIQHLAEESAHRKATMLQIVNEAFTEYLRSGDWEACCRTVLRQALDQGGYQCAYLCLHPDTAQGCAILAEPAEYASESLPCLCALAGVTSDCRSKLQPGEFDTKLDGLAARYMAVPIHVGRDVVGVFGLLYSAETNLRYSNDEAEVLAQALGMIYEGQRRSLRHAELERDLQQSQKMEAMGRLAGGVAHDFNNLLTVIMGYGELAADTLGDDHPVEPYVREMLSAGERATALARQLLTFSRREAVTTQDVNVNEVLSGLTKILQRVIGEDVDLHVHPAHDLELIAADPGQIEQVIMNLAVNARDAMPRGGRLDIATANLAIAAEGEVAGLDAGRYVELVVRDRGCGMDSATLERIFEPFFTTKPEGKGTGLGLATVYGIVQQRAGQIRVESAPGVGTTFRVYFPCAQQKRKVSEAAVATVPNGCGHESILLVEDSDIVRKLTSRILQDAGYDVLQAASGDEALRLCRDHAKGIDLVITDVVMPHMSGQELVDRLQQNGGAVRALLMSGYTDDALERYGVHQDEVNFIAKPFKQNVLLDKVRETLQR
jgi:PAS domain S-box-containing protein